VTVAVQHLLIHITRHTYQGQHTGPAIAAGLRADCSISSLPSATVTPKVCHLHDESSTADAEKSRDNLFHVILSCGNSFSSIYVLPLYTSTLLIQHIRGAPWYRVPSTALSSMHNDSSLALPLTMLPKYYNFSLVTLLVSCFLTPDFVLQE